MITSEILMLLRVPPFPVFHTPIVWTGYILFVDALVFRLRGDSLLTRRFRDFVLMVPVSIFCWLIFELYNVRLENWEYRGLPDNLWVRGLGYGWSFATIFPGVLETSELIDALGIFRNVRIRPRIIYKAEQNAYLAFGILMLAVPPLLPVSISRYLFAFIWMGFIFLLEPLNFRLKVPSILADWERGRWEKFLSLFLAGLICGLLWEFWNYWAETKWVYKVPIFPETKLFEMPLIGYLGFLPFALECHAMFYFARYWLVGRSEKGR